MAILMLNVSIAEIFYSYTVKQEHINTKLQCNIDVLHKNEKQNCFAVLNQKMAVSTDFLQIQK
jgi:hypothetical protein